MLLDFKVWGNIYFNYVIIWILFESPQHSTCVASHTPIPYHKGVLIKGVWFKPLGLPYTCHHSRSSWSSCHVQHTPPSPHHQVQASVSTTFSTPHQPITCKQVSKCHHMCVGAFIMPSNHIKCKQWASWPLQGHQGLHQGFQVFIKSSMTTSSPLRRQSHQMWVQGFLQGFFIKQEASSTTSTTQGDLHGSRSIMTSPVGLPNLLLGYHDIIRAWMTT